MKEKNEKKKKKQKNDQEKKYQCINKNDKGEN